MGVGSLMTDADEAPVSDQGTAEGQEVRGLTGPEAAPFTSLAAVYDDIMAEVEYEEWCEFIWSVARDRGYSGGPLHDLGCGTGNATAPMFRRGLEVSGSDAS